jgi:hypothetical protein
MSRGGRSISVVDHIFDKLIHIKLPEILKNSYLTELYQKKHDEMVQFALKHAPNGYVDYKKDLMKEYELHGKEWENLE